MNLNLALAEDISFTYAPHEVHVGAIVLNCEHQPLTNWLTYDEGIVADFQDGTQTNADFLALCDKCSNLPVHKVYVSVSRRVPEGHA